MDESRRFLDLDAVQSFLLVTELRSFTRTAEVLQTTQAAVSLKIKRLEELLGYQLLVRTPRRVDLTSEGSDFVPKAQALLKAHEFARDGSLVSPSRRLVFGISDHVAGPSLATLIASLALQSPQSPMDVRVSSSRDIVAAFDRRDLDFAIVRREGKRRDGTVLGREPISWFGLPNAHHRPGEPVRLATLASPCGVRDIAVGALDEAAVPWIETFVGGGVLAVGAAVVAGLGVAALLRRSAPPGTIDVTRELQLPPLPDAEIVFYSRTGARNTPITANALAAAFRRTR
jgi:DNA-binding transcriptional LysR family regulator